MKNQFKNTLVYLQIAAVCVFAGRAYQHLFWDAPYREILWDPVFTAWAVNLFTDMTWGEFVTHPQGDIWIQKIVKGFGVFYLMCALICAFIHKIKKWGKALIILGSFGLLILAAIYAKDKFFHLGQFLEYALQFSTPVFLLYLISKKEISQTFMMVVKFTIALTFTCHGLYAFGYYPYPGSFMTMTQNILGLSQSNTILFLNAAGVLDFIVAVGIFLPGKWGRAALLYCVLWGLLTSLARIFGNFYSEYPLESLHQWVYEAVMRAPHFMVPLWAWLIEKRG